MNSFNPFQMMNPAQMMNPGQMIQQMMKGQVGNSQPQNQIPQMNLGQLKLGMSKMTKETLVQLVQQARAQGMDEEQIKQGLDFLLNLK